MRPPTLREARLEDYQEIARLGTANSLRTQPYDEWAKMWLGGPLWPRLGRAWPIGWVLEDPQGKIVGTLMSIPAMYAFRGDEVIASASRAWAVDVEYRGYSAWLLDEYLNHGASLCVMTTAGPMAAPLVSKLARQIPVGDWATCSRWRMGYGTIVERKLARLRVPMSAHLGNAAGVALSLKDRLGRRQLAKLPRRYVLEQLDTFDERFDLFWKALVDCNPAALLANRSSDTLRWHFDGAARANGLWVFAASQGSSLRAYCIFVVKGEGYDRYARLVDYQTVEPEYDALSGFLRAAIARCAMQGIGVLENIGRGVPKMRAADEAAPIRCSLPSWRFYYHTSDAALQTALTSRTSWDPSTYDGDASIG
ncbi:MAG TPA: hypothetical protein VEJ41_02545 [Candidatus Acidoferrales bacterium]|nr:hypothetical protein [Candidatus Acidoferrales bacterium]